MITEQLFYHSLRIIWNIVIISTHNENNFRFCSYANLAGVCLRFLRDSGFTRIFDLLWQPQDNEMVRKDLEFFDP